MNRLLAATCIFWLSAGLQAAPVILDSTVQCSAGNQANGIAIGDVTGDAGGASDCWGTFNGNNSGNGPGSAPDGFSIGGDVYTEIAKEDTPGGLSGANIGLVVTPSGGALSGDWKFNQGALMGNNFLIVLKASNSPGYGVWLFSGADAASFSGTWQVVWGHNLSHLSVYKGPKSPDDPGGQVPVPATLWLFGAGLVGLGFSKRKR